MEALEVLSWAVVFFVVSMGICLLVLVVGMVKMILEGLGGA